MLRSLSHPTLFAWTLLYVGCTKECIGADPEPGDRPDCPENVQDPQGCCPADETCSRVVTRLFFTGASLGDIPLSSFDAPYAIALGGTQTIAVWRDEMASQLFDTAPDDREGSIPDCGADLAFCAYDSGLARLQVPRTAPMVQVTGRDEGPEHLRIFANSRDEENRRKLYDRIVLHVAEPNDMYVVAPPDLEFSLVHGDAAKDTAVVFMTGSRPPAIVIGIFGPVNGDRVRLVDDSLAIENLPANIRRSSQWDSLYITEPLSSATNRSLLVSSGNRLPRSVALRVVEAIKDLDIAYGAITSVDKDEPLNPGWEYKVCFSAFAAPEVNGGTKPLIYGAKLLIEPIQNVGVHQTSDECATIRAIGPRIVLGDSEVRVSGPGTDGPYRETFRFDVR